MGNFCINFYLKYGLRVVINIDINTDSVIFSNFQMYEKYMIHKKLGKFFMNKLLVRILTGFMPSKEMRRAFRTQYLCDSSNKIIIVTKGGVEKRVNSVAGLRIEFHGKNSIVKISESVKFCNCILRLGENNFIEIQNSKYCISNFVLPCPMRENSKLLIGKDFSCVECRVFMHDEPNINVTIGEDCMFSFGVIIWPSDGHSIIDENKKVLNKGENITIGNHTWLGMNTTILKGSVILDNSVIGARTVFTKSSNSLEDGISGGIFAGMPAKLIKSGINWDRRACYDFLNVQDG